MPRKNLIAGNWKMNNTIPEAVVLAQEISNRMERDWLELVDVAVCPPFVDLKPVKSVFEFDRVDIAVGAQNVYWEPKGAFTGESTSMPFCFRYAFTASMPSCVSQRVETTTTR